MIPMGSQHFNVEHQYQHLQLTTMFTSVSIAIMTTYNAEVEVLPLPYTAEEARDMWVDTLLSNVHYWNGIQPERNPYTFETFYQAWPAIASGLMHSFHSTMAGESSGFSEACTMEAKFRHYDGAHNINNGTLQYVFLDSDSCRAEHKEELNELSYDTAAVDHLRLLWLTKLETIADKVDASDLTHEDKTFAFIREVLDFIVNGDDRIENIAIMVDALDANKPFRISRGQRYLESTYITGLEENLVDCWDRKVKESK